MAASGSLDRLGVALDTDIFTFMEYFRKVVGEDFRTWRQRLRIEEACRIMEEDPSMSYEIVSEAVGINDRSNFKKSFVKFKGMTPADWKRQK